MHRSTDIIIKPHLQYMGTCGSLSHLPFPPCMPGMRGRAAPSRLPPSGQTSSRHRIRAALRAPAYLSQEEKESGTSCKEGKKPGSKAEQEEDVRRSVLDAPLERGARPAASDARDKEVNSSSSSGSNSNGDKEHKPFHLQLGSKGGAGPGGGGPPSSPPGRPTPGKLLAGNAAYTGLVGTLAIVAANAVHLDIFNLFDWQALATNNQLVLALGLSLPLQVVNLIIMGRSYSAWKLPKLTQEEELELGLAGSGRKGGADSSRTSSSSDGSSSGTNAFESGSETDGSSSSASENGRGQGAIDSDNIENGASSSSSGSKEGSSNPSSKREGSSLSSSSRRGDACVSNNSREDARDISSSSSSSGGKTEDVSTKASSSNAPSGAREVPLRSFKPPLDGKLPTKLDQTMEEGKLRVVSASSWGAGGGGGGGNNQPLPNSVFGVSLPSRKTLRDALHLAQGNYVTMDSTASLPSAAKLGVILADGVASELLYRGVAVGIVAGWLRDRAYEGGASEFISMPGPIAHLINTAAAISAGADPSDLSAGEGLTGSSAVVGSTDLPGPMSPDSVAEWMLLFLHGRGELVALDDASRWAAGALLIGALTSLAAQRVAKSRRKVAVVADLRGRFSEVLAKQRDQKAKLDGSTGKGGSDNNSSDSSSSSSSSSRDNKASSSKSSNNRIESMSSNARSVEGTNSSNNEIPSTQSDTRGKEGTWAQGEASSSTSSGSSTQANDDGAPDTRRSPPQPSAEAMLQLQGMLPPGTVMLAAGGGNKGGGGPGGSGSGGPQVVLDPLIWSTIIQASRDLLQTVTLVGVFVASGGNLAASYIANVANQIVFTLLQELCAQRARERSADMVRELEQFNEKLRRIAAKKKMQQQKQGDAGAAPGAQAPQTLPTSSVSEPAPQEKPGAQAPPERQQKQPQGDLASKESSVKSKPKTGKDSAVSRALSLLDSLLPEDQGVKK